MKKTALFLAGLLLLSIFAGCAARGLKRPETNLEFWLGEKVDEAVFAEHTERTGVFGGREFYGLGFTPAEDGETEAAEPEKYVLYTVTAYPDYSSGDQCVTRITIADPAVNVYGLTVDSPLDKIRAVMRENGFRERTDSAAAPAFEKGRMHVSFPGGRIVISVEVTNRKGIVF